MESAMLFDTHAHLTDEAFDADRDEVLSALKDGGVSLVLNAGSSVASSLKSAALAEKYSFVYASAGVHPHDSANAGEDYQDELFKLAKRDKVVAIGEIGLDYHYDFSPREVQLIRFEEQIALAAELNLPVIIHDREAHEDCLKIVKKFKNIRGVFHCYSGSLEFAKELVKLGLSLSFTGAVTFKNARRAHEVIKWLPGECIMIETDSPYLTPEPFRGRRNDPRMVRFAAEKLAEIRSASFDEIAALTMKNGMDFFNIGE